MNTFHCSMCCFSCQNYSQYCIHIIRMHKHDPNVIVQCSDNSCAYSTKSWNAYKLHASRKHKHVQNMETEQDEMQEDVSLESNTGIVPSDRVENLNVVIDEDVDTSMQKAFYNAHFLLHLESGYNLPKVAIDSVVSALSFLIEDHQACYKQQLWAALREHGIGDNVLNAIQIQPEHMLHVFKTDYTRQKFYSSFCELVSPKSVLLGTIPKVCRGQIQQVERLGYYIPFFDSLQSLFDLPEIPHYFDHSHCSLNEFMFDLCDGNVLKHDPLYKRNPNAIQIILNTDDIEVVNPLGSHVKKHKLTMFYYSIGNIPPQFRSQLASIQLLAVARTRDVKKFGMDQLLSDFVTSVNILTNGGKMFTFGNVTKNVEGTIVIAPCDTPAAAWLDGFKEGVGFAYKGCRTCDISPDDVSTRFVSNPNDCRSASEHNERSQDLSPQAKTYWSKMWGINGTSILCNIRDLNISRTLVHDPMHVLLEGIVQHELRLFIFYCTQSRKYFSLKWLNEQVEIFQYNDHDRKNKPQIIDGKALKPGGRIKQTAIEMLTLFCLLPFLIGSKILRGDKHWVNLLHLLQITLLSLSPCVSKTTASELQQLIFTYLSVFKACYPKASFLPKMHFLTHFPQQILDFGPLRHQWCMRFEGKHGFFKKIKWTNFKNLPLSVAFKHQQWMCYKQLGPNGQRTDNFLYDGDKISCGQEISISQLFPHFSENFNVDKGYLVSEINIHGTRYKNGPVVVLGMESLPCTPILRVIKDILVVNLVKHFVVAQLEVRDFDEHLNAYIVEECNDCTDIITYRDLIFKWPENIYNISGRKCLMIRNCPFVEPLSQ